MKPVHLPRTLLTAILVTVATVTVAGILRAFSTADVQASAVATATAVQRVTITPGITPSSTPPPVRISGDTTGIIALAIIIVIIVLVGTIFSLRMPSKNKR